MFSPIVAWAAVLLAPSTGVVAALAIVTLRVMTFEKLSAAGTFDGVALVVSMLLAGVYVKNVPRFDSVWNERTPAWLISVRFGPTLVGIKTL